MLCRTKSCRFPLVALIKEFFVSDSIPLNPWKDDLLGYSALGETYTNLIQSIDDSKVISIEAGFGRGKTFFREAWASQLREAGEVVIEIDAQQSDHSGDPVVTFLAALMDALEPKEKSQWTQAIAKGTGLALGTAKLFASIAARKAGGDAVDGIEAWLKSDGEESKLDEIVADFSEEASKTLTAQLTAQIAAERVRTQEMPTQMKALREALTEGKGTDRVVILIDELDRCHPEYAISLLEAMKLVFNQDGYVFVLIVNADHLERLAGSRFGAVTEDERYLDKFVDIRLQLPKSDETIGQAAFELVSKLPLEVPFGKGQDFTVERAAELAKTLAPISGLTMRQIKRLLLKVEIALRCYQEVPLDAPLLVFLAFQEELLPVKLSRKYLPRFGLSKKLVDDLRAEQEEIDPMNDEKIMERGLTDFIRHNCIELLKLPDDRYGLPDNKNYRDWAKVMFLAENYLKSHLDVLNAAHQLSAE